MSEVTRILAAAGAGDRQAAADLLPLVYDELRKLAAVRLAAEPVGQTLQPTALVHEAYLRLAGAGARWDHRGHFFAAAAAAMRRILIESARRKLAAKYGGGLNRCGIDPDELQSPVRPNELLAMDDALMCLEAVKPRAAEVVKLRFFAGLTLDEVATALGISSRTADDDWAYARAWLLSAMNCGNHDT